MRYSLVWMALLGCAAIAPLAAQERQIRISLTVPAVPEQVWNLWTTDDGIRSFFAPGSHVDLRVDRWYEIYFDPSAPPGQRGADSMRLLVVEPNRRLGFTWNAPGTMPYIRGQRTVVYVDLTPVGADSTRVVLRHTGWGTGPEWDQAIRYFEQAWNGFVMAALRYRVEHGPVNWSSMSRLEPVQKTAIEYLTPVSR
jgi:uncharacterized protein YndB with AHSA1/START domain